MDETDLIVDSAKESMSNAIEHLEKELLNIRAGKANPIMLSNITIDYYGSKTPLSQVANINTPDSKTIAVQPWEKSLTQDIEKAILIANIGFTPINNGDSIIINIPPMTEERRFQLVKITKQESENAKVSIRNSRKEANDDIKKIEVSDDMKKNLEDDIQNLTDAFIKKTDLLFSKKEKEIMTV
ncbi:MAG: ribosome recycling factor [Flavobacteriaceae bacterium]|nr:ribosome recycling factor [Flavobacteriaceae bacterium]|tara:strand:+ start:5913 stop:6464 length:552 start_codon:yes stop_codon:yes gene_type:complete